METNNLEQYKNNARGPYLRLGFCIRFSAREDKQQLVHAAMGNVLPIVEKETDTIAWFAFRWDEYNFGAFDVFYNEEARSDHWETGSKGVEKMTQTLINKTVDVDQISLVAAKLGEKTGLKPQDSSGALVWFKVEENEQQSLESVLRDLHMEAENQQEVIAWFAFRSDQDKYGLFWAGPGNNTNLLERITNFIVPGSYNYTDIQIITAKV